MMVQQQVDYFDLYYMIKVACFEFCLVFVHHLLIEDVLIVNFVLYFVYFSVKKMSVNVADPGLKEFYDDVRSDKSKTNWCLFKYSDDGKSILPDGKGEGGLEELKSRLDIKQCQYGFLRVISGDEESKRAKFVFLTFGGSSAPTLRRGKMSVHKLVVQTIIKDYAVTVHGEDLSDFKEDTILGLVRKAGGADYSGNKSGN